MGANFIRGTRYVIFLHVYQNNYCIHHEMMGALWWWVFLLNLEVVVMTLAVVNNLEVLVITFCC